MNTFLALLIIAAGLLILYSLAGERGSWEERQLEKTRKTLRKLQPKKKR